MFRFFFIFSGAASRLFEFVRVLFAELVSALQMFDYIGGIGCTMWHDVHEAPAGDDRWHRDEQSWIKIGWKFTTALSGMDEESESISDATTSSMSS